MQSTSLTPKDELNFEVEASDTWQLVTVKNLSWVSSNACMTAFAKHLALENLLLGMVIWVYPCEKSESNVWSDSLEDLSAPEGGWRFLGCTFSYVMFEGRVVDSNMDGFSSFSVNLCTVLVSLFWSVRCWLGDAHWKCCVCKLH